MSAMAAQLSKIHEGAKLQWHKLRHAWALMEAEEARRGSSFSMVMKLRFDATPMLPFRPCVPPAGSDSLSLLAATDKIFWGARAPMAVAANMHAAIAPVFEQASAASAPRWLSLRRWLDSASALPASAWSTEREGRQHYNKVAMLPYPRLARSRHDALSADPRSQTLTHIRTLLDARVDGIEPYDLRAVGIVRAAAAANGSPSVTLAHGLRSSELDRSANVFIAERDFLLWMLWHNVTVCDLGAGSNAILYKGVTTPRPSVHCPAMADGPLEQPASFEKIEQPGNDGSLDSGVSNGALRPRVHIRLGQRTDGRLSFMFAPIVRTLLLGFNATGASVSIEEVSASEDGRLKLSREARRLGRRDAFVWIGVKQHAFPPWQEMRHNSVRTIYYQTEPLPAGGGCLLPPNRRASTSIGSPLVDELWDYSEWNLMQCARLPHTPILRLLPPGDVSTRRIEHAAGGGGVSRVLFLGDVTLEERASCFAPLRSLVTPINDVWSEEALAKLVATHPPPIFINLHKRCAAQSEAMQPIEAVRLSQLLSLGAIVLSQRSNPRDEARYAGIVEFATIQELPAAIRKLQQRGDLRELADARSKRFMELFRPQMVVARALARQFH